MSATTITSLWFKDEQYKKVKEMADLHGISVTRYMREAVLERTEDEADYHDAMVNLADSHGESVPSNEIRHRLGLDQ